MTTYQNVCVMGISFCVYRFLEMKELIDVFIFIFEVQYLEYFQDVRQKWWNQTDDFWISQLELVKLVESSFDAM